MGEKAEDDVMIITDQNQDQNWTQLSVCHSGLPSLPPSLPPYIAPEELQIILGTKLMELEIVPCTSQSFTWLNTFTHTCSSQPEI